MHKTSFSKAAVISTLWWILFLGIFSGLIGYVMWDIFRPLAGTSVDILSDRTHVKEAEHPTYNTNPPTSGPHYAKPEDWGVV